MKVICIDAKVRSYTYKGVLNELIEGDIYEVEKSTFCNLGTPMYLLVGFVELDHRGLRIGYAVDRFIPLSEIDELKLVNNNNNKELV